MTVQDSPAWLEMVQRLIESAGKPAELPVAVKRIAEVAKALTGADVVSLFAVNPITARFQPAPAIIGDLYGNPAEYHRAPSSDGIAADVFKTGAIFLDDLVSSPAYQSTFAHAEQVRSLAIVGLRTADSERFFGILYINFRTPQIFSSELQKQLVTFAALAAAVLRNVWFLRRYHRVIEIGRDIIEHLGEATDLFRRLPSRLAGIIDVSNFLLLAVYKPELRRFDHYMVENGEYKFLGDQPYDGGCRWVLENNKEIFIRNLNQEQATLEAKLIDIPGTVADEQSLVFVPIIFCGNVPLGALSVQHPKANVYDEEDVHLLQALANHLALALSNIRLYHSLDKLNKAGQFLTTQFHTEGLLQNVADQARLVSGADLVTLYRYIPERRHFDLPPTTSGEPLHPEFPQPTVSHRDDMATMTVAHGQAEFAKDSRILYERLGGDPKQRKGSFERREAIASSAAVPLRVAQRTVGVLFVNFRQPQRFDAPQRELIQNLANYAAIAISNAELFEQTSTRRVRELERLSEIERRITSSLDLREVLDEILTAAVQEIPVADEASVLLLEAKTQILRMAAAQGRHAWASLLQTIHLEAERSIAGLAVETRQPVRVDDVRQPLWSEQHFSVAEDILSELDVPIFDGTQVIGVINLESTRRAAFSKDDQHFLETLAGQAAIAIRNAERYEELQHSRAWLEAYSEIDKAIVESVQRRTLDDVLQLILEQGMKLTQSPRGNIMWYDREREDLVLRAQKGESAEGMGTRQQIGRGIVGMAALKRETYVIADVTAEPWSAIYLPFIPGMRSELAVPLLEGDLLLGVLNVEHPEVNAYSLASQHRLEALARQAVIAIQNITRYEEAENGRRRLQALHEIDEKIIQQVDDPEQVIQTILEHALKLAGAESGDLHLYENSHVTVTYFARLDEQGHLLAVERIDAGDVTARPIERGIVEWVAQFKKPYRTRGDAQQDSTYRGERDIHSEVAVPLLLGQGQLVGVLNLESPQLYAFDDEHVEMLEFFAGQVVIAIQNARYFADVRNARARFELLADLGKRLLTAPLDRAAMLKVVLDEGAARFGKSHSFSIRLWDEEANLLRLHATQSLEGGESPIQVIHPGNGANGWVATHRRSCRVADVDNPPPGVTYLRGHSRTRSELVVPLIAQNRYFGNLDLGFPTVNAFDDSDVALAEGIADQVANALYRLEVEQARQEAEQREREAAVMASLGQSALELAHRLGNGLGLVRSHAGDIREILASSPELSQAVEESLSSITTDVQQVLALAVALRDEIVRSREGEGHIVQALPTQALLEEAVQAIGRLPANVQVQFECAADVAPVLGVYTQLLDILCNLFKNAIDAMPNGGVVTLRARNVGRHVELQVADTGVGISSERQARIFDLFYSTKGSFGFGLWSARRYALANGGELRVVSQPGQGATLILQLPRGDGQPGEL